MIYTIVWLDLQIEHLVVLSKKVIPNEIFKNEIISLLGNLFLVLNLEEATIHLSETEFGITCTFG